VLAAEGAILVQFNTVGRVFLVLEGIVVSVLAVVAPEYNLNSHFGTSLFYLAKRPVASLFGTEIKILHEK
jgi:hypothetical protein